MAGDAHDAEAVPATGLAVAGRKRAAMASSTLTLIGGVFAALAAFAAVWSTMRSRAEQQQQNEETQAFQKELSQRQAETVELAKRLTILVEQQELNIAASRPIRYLEVRFKYASQKQAPPPDGGSKFLLMIQMFPHTKIAASTGFKPSPFSPELPVAPIHQQVQAGGFRSLTVQPAKGASLPSMHELRGSWVAIAVSDDWFDGLEEVVLLADGFQIATSVTSDPAVALGLNGEWQFGAGTPPRARSGSDGKLTTRRLTRWACSRFGSRRRSRLWQPPRSERTLS